MQTSLSYGLYLFSGLLIAVISTSATYAENRPHLPAGIVAVTDKMPIDSEEYTDKVLPAPAQKRSNPGAMDKEDIELYFFDEANDDPLPPEKQLSPDTKATLENISKNIGQQGNTPSQAIIIDRGNKRSTVSRENNESEETDTSFSVSLKEPKNQPLDIETLNAQAYKALIVGQKEAAASLYKRALKMAPDNYPALFGLATTYHQSKQFRQARDLYTNILKKYPNDTDTLNNFLVLIAEEAPEDALKELKKLEKNNMNYSPITAQIGMLYMKLGKQEKAVRYLKQAVAMSPSNISYRYNLAILLDKMQRYREAAALYRQLLAASRRGISIPGNIPKMDKRLKFIEAQY